MSNSQPATPGDQYTRFSDSPIWTWQREYYIDRGADAWSSGQVPYGVTCNPALANAYAQLCVAWLLDQLSRSALDPSEPVYIVELGCGSGRFSHYFLQWFSRHRKRFGLNSPIVLVLTDLAQKNIDRLAQHPSIRPWIERGMADLARFDVENDCTLLLQCSGRRLEPGGVKNPLVVVANYLFDSIPCDLFRLERGKLYESVAELPILPPGTPVDSRLELVELQFDERLVEDTYYTEPLLEQTLQRYRQLDREGHLLMPTAAMRCCNNLQELSAGRLLLLAADHGWIEEELALREEAPTMWKHGAISVPVNFHAIVSSFDVENPALVYRQGDRSLTVVALMLDGQLAEFPRVSAIFEQVVDLLTPLPPDLRRLQESKFESLELRQLLELLDTAGSDPWLLRACWARVLELVPEATSDERSALKELVVRAGANYFHLGEHLDFPAQLGQLLLRLGAPKEAIVFFQRSLYFYGDHPDTYGNLALCYHRLKQPLEALRYVDYAKRLKNELEP